MTSVHRIWFVFNAGAFAPGSILEISPDQFEHCWRVGRLGGFHVGQLAAKAMVRKGAGTMLFTGATASLRGSARFVNRAVPKFGLRALAQSMAWELGSEGIHVGHIIVDGQIESYQPALRLTQEGDSQSGKSLLWLPPVVQEVSDPSARVIECGLL